MAKIEYSLERCAELFAAANDPALRTGHRRTRYEAGDELQIEITGVFPAVQGKAVLVIDKFLGGGFAGQVYRCRLASLDLPEGQAVDGLETGKLYAVKIIIPPSNFSLWFRNTIYWLAFQGPFSAQVNYGACRAGLIMQKLMRRAAQIKFGRETAVKDAYASFWDANLNAYGEITEWIEGRMWLLEADDDISRRRKWRSVELTETASAEYVAKRRFMADMAALMHEMGAPEFARQYEWWTMKSQPNVMKRTDLPDETGPAGGLCAIDFRAGLALLPWLPMSPGDIKLILDGLFLRKTLVQFDRCDLDKLDRYIAAHHEYFDDLRPAVEELKERDRVYRRSLPDITRHGLKLIIDNSLRCDVRAGLIEGWRADGLIDDAFEQKLRPGGLRFAGFYLTGILPVFGKLFRKLRGNAAWRMHIQSALRGRGYRVRAVRAHVANRLLEWHRAGRVSEKHTRLLLNRPILYFAERFTAGLLPPGLHRALTEPSRVWNHIRNGFLFLRNFIRSAEFREQWFLNEIALGEKDGMLTAEERAHIESVVKDPFIVKYLKCLGVHFATLPVTQIVSVTIGAGWACWLRVNGHPWGEALGAFGLTVAVFQIIPISPGSICRGGFVVGLMIKERNLRDYIVAAPVSFLKYIGYLAFPLQMTTTYPHLARFMASRWATGMVHVIPVFGEKGALLEHWIFDLFFNQPQKFAKWAMPRIHWILDGWMIAGLALCSTMFYRWQPSLTDPKGFNLLLGTIVVFLLPRLLFYPLMMRKKHRPAADAKL